MIVVLKVMKSTLIQTVREIYTLWRYIQNPVCCRGFWSCISYWLLLQTVRFSL